MSTRYFARFRSTVFIVVMLAGANTASPFAQEDNRFLEACRLFGGRYEQRRVGCDPDCVVTQLCLFSEGGGRICDEEGRCSTLSSEGLSGEVARETEPSIEKQSSEPRDSATEEPFSYEDCIEEASDSCRDECDSKTGPDRARCTRNCLNDECEEYESDTESLEGEDEDRDECRKDCKTKCASQRVPTRGPVRVSA